MTFLEGIRILDLTRVLAGPLATQTLADLGASVLKIEAPNGDDTRQWGPPFQDGTAAYYQSCNRSKASLVLDFKDDEALAKLHALVKTADVVIDNFVPKTRARWGLSQGHIRALNPKSITMSITGYAGQRKNEPGYDVMVQAESGFMAIGGPVEGEPSKVGVPVVDILTGIMATNGILAALFRREREGKGASLEISLFQTGLFSLVNVASNFLVSGNASKRWGNAHPNIVPYQPFKTADGDLVIGTGNTRQFKKLCHIAGIEDPGILVMTNAQRVAQRDMLIPLLAGKLATRGSSHWLKALRDAGIPSAPILRPDEALSQVSGWDPDALIAVANRKGEPVHMVAPPLRGEGMRTNHLAPPELGEGGEALADSWLAGV